MQPSLPLPRQTLRSLNLPRTLRRPTQLRYSPSQSPRTLNPSTSSRLALRPLLFSRPLTSSPRYNKGLSPESSDPAPPNTQPTPEEESISAAADLSDSQYHEIADEYLNNLLLALEEKAEATTEVEVEYSAGVLTLNTPKGTYILNKQPPNKQIWLSSPVSGPKRFDWVVAGSHATQYEKQDSEDGDEKGDDGQGGKWIYLRDKSSLTEILGREVGVEVSGSGGAS